MSETSAAPQAPAPTQATPVEAPSQEMQQAPVSQAPTVQEPAQSVQNTQPLVQEQSDPDPLADLLSDVSENDYNYDYDDIQLENGVIGTDADKATTNAIAKELGLSREQARKLYQKGGEILRQQQLAAHNEQIKAWNQQFQTDPEIGGANLPAAKANFKAAIQAFGSPELTALLSKVPLHRAPAIFKFIAKAGQAVSGDTNFTQGTTVAPHKLSEREEFLRQFPNSEYLLDDNFRN